MSLSVALNRFGLGARPDELVHSDSQAWLVSQLLSYDPLPAAWKQQPRTAALVGTWNDMQRSVRLAPEGQRSGIREKYLRDGSLVYQAAVGARTASALESSTDTKSILSIASSILPDPKLDSKVWQIKQRISWITSNYLTTIFIRNSLEKTLWKVSIDNHVPRSY